MKKIPQFKSGEVVLHKTDSPHKIVILKPMWRLWGVQRYLVSWFDGKEYLTGVALEVELYEKI